MARKKSAGGQKDGGQSGTTAQRKRMVTEIFRQNLTAIQRVRDDNYAKEKDLDGRRLQRRMKAVLNAMDRAVAEFRPRCPDIDSIEETLTKLESIPLGSYDDENYCNCLYLAAALWILDDLKKSGKPANCTAICPRTSKPSWKWTSRTSFTIPATSRT